MGVIDEWDANIEFGNIDANDTTTYSWFHWQTLDNEFRAKRDDQLRRHCFDQELLAAEGINGIEQARILEEYAAELLIIERDYSKDEMLKREQKPFAAEVEMDKAEKKAIQNRIKLF